MADSMKISKRTAFKVVVRRLSAEMTSEQLVKILAGEGNSSNLTEENYWFCNPDPSLGQFSFTRAYLTFPCEQQAIEFCRQYNGYVFVDQKGNDSIANVEFAPYAAVPSGVKGRTAKEQDRRCNTLDEDSDYMQFLTDFNERLLSAKKRVSLDELAKELEEGREKGSRALNVKSTPLTEFLTRGENKKASNSAKSDRGNFKAEPSTPAPQKSSSSRRERREKKQREGKTRAKEEERGTNQISSDGGKVMTILKRDSTKQQLEEVTASVDSKGGKAPAPSALGTGRERKIQHAGGSSAAEKPVSEPESREQQPSLASTRKDAQKSIFRSAKRGDATDESKSARRNKDRPERAIYQPSRVRRDGAGADNREKSCAAPTPAVKILRRGSGEKASEHAPTANSSEGNSTRPSE